MRKNVLEIIGSFHMGGSERQAVQVSRQLHKDGTFGVYVACLDRRGVLRADIESIGLDVIPEFPLTSFYDMNFWRQIRQCVRFIKQNDISIVHTHDFYTNVFGMIASFLARTQVRIASKRNTFSKTKKQALLELQAFRLATCIQVNAEAVRDVLVKGGVPDSKIVTIYNGVELAQPAEQNNYVREELIRKFGLEVASNAPIVTIVANLRSPVKNHEMFLRAARRVKEQCGNANFVIAGEGELVEPMAAFAESLGIIENIFFLGRCTDVPGLLSISDVCVLSSRSEGFSNSILEYMAAGKPVVATRVGGAREVIRDGGSGYLVDSDDEESMAERIIDLLKDPEKAERFGRCGRQIIENEFSATVQLAETINLYRKLLGQHLPVTKDQIA